MSAECTCGMPTGYCHEPDCARVSPTNHTVECERGISRVSCTSSEHVIRRAAEQPFDLDTDQGRAFLNAREARIMDGGAR